MLNNELEIQPQCKNIFSKTLPVILIPDNRLKANTGDKESRYMIKVAIHQEDKINSENAATKCVKSTW